MRFELIDTVVEQEADRIVAVKNVTSAEEYLADHFPGFPVLPGVLMLEALIQSGRRLLEATHGPGPWVLAEVRNVRYGSMVRPGEQLRLTVELRKSDGEHHQLQGRGTVGEEAAVQGRFALRPMRSPGGG